MNKIFLITVKSRQFIIAFAMVCVLVLFPVHGYAQQAKCTITGKVVDAGQQPISYASVAAYVGSSPVAGVITDGNGEFALKMELTGSECRLAVEFIGYAKYEGLITTDKPHIHLGVIILREDAKALDEVVVSAKAAAQKSTVEHTTINASASMASSKGTAIDVLRSASAVSVSNDEISIRGNSNILVLMDGVPTTASDLSTIPAANIQSIEVITNPDASHDAGGTGGIINIISKRSRAEGFSGMVAANYGFSHFTNGNIALSHNRPKAAWRLNYNTKYEDDIVHSTLHRKVHSTDYEVSQQMQSTRYTFNNNLSLGADFRFNPRHRLSVDVKAIVPRLNIRQNLHNTFADRTESRHNDVTWNRENLEGSVAYTHVIRPEVSDITLRGSVSKIWGSRPSHYSLEGIEYNRSVSGGSPFIPALQADYKHKFKAGTLSAGAKLTYRQNDVYHDFYELVSGEWTYSDAMSKDMLHTEWVPAAYLLYSSRIGSQFTYKAGLRGEYSTVTLSSRHDAIDELSHDLFLAPSLSGTYRLTEAQDLSLALSRRIGRPTYPQLIPYMSMVDATTYEQGNMHLTPEKATKVDLSYNLHREAVTLFVNAYLGYTTGYISQITKMDGERLITTYANADSDIKTGMELSLKVTPARWVTLSMGANTYYMTAEGTFEGAHIDNRGWTNNSNLMLDLTPWHNGDIQLQYFLTTPQYYPQLTTAFTHQMNLGYKQRLMKGALTLSMLVTDIFDTARWEVWSRNNLFDLTNSSKNKSRMLWLGMSYNFNSFKQKGTPKSETDRSLIRLGL